VATRRVSKGSVVDSIAVRNLSSLYISHTVLYVEEGAKNYNILTRGHGKRDEVTGGGEEVLRGHT
jgi:hypothetical protein